MMNCGNNDNEKKITYKEQRFLNVLFAIAFCLLFTAINTFFIGIWLGKIYNNYLVSNKTDETQAYKQEIEVTLYDTISDLTDTIWVFDNTILNKASSLITYAINFNLINSYPELYEIYIPLTTVYSGNSYPALGIDGDHYALCQNIINGSWVVYDWDNSEVLYQLGDSITIEITGGTDATNSTLISWLQANATLQNNTPTPTQLTAPTILYRQINNNNYISWTPIANSSGYKIYKDNVEIQDATFYSDGTYVNYLITQNGSYKVVALGDGTNYSDSDYSNVLTLPTYTLSTPTLEYNFSFVNGGVLSWNFVTVSGLTQNFDIYKDGNFYANTSNHTYNVTENGVYQVMQKSNLMSYADSSLSNSITLSNIRHITYNLPNNTTSRTYFSANNSTTLSSFYFNYDSDNLPYTIFTIDNNNSATGYVFKSVNDFSTSSNVEFDTTILNNQIIRVDYSSITGDITANLVNYSATKISGNTYYFYSVNFADNLVIGDYLLTNRPFTSNQREFNNIFVNSYNYLVYDDNGSQDNLVYFLSNLTGQYMNNSTYNYYLISFSAVDSDNTYFIQDYIANDDIFFDYYRIATQSDYDNINALNDQLIYINDNYTFLSLFGSIIDAHFNTLKSLLNFQFFGINLWSIFTLLLTISLVFMALKFLRGGGSKKE